MNLDFQVCVRTHRMFLARALMRVLSVVRFILPRSWTVMLARLVVCRVAIFELKTGDGFWRRVRIRPEELTIS